MAEKIRGQTLKDAKGTIRVEQGPGGWHVKVGAKGYIGGIFDTKEEALEYVAQVARKANAKRRGKCV